MTPTKTKARRSTKTKQQQQQLRIFSHISTCGTLCRDKQQLDPRDGFVASAFRPKGNCTLSMNTEKGKVQPPPPPIESNGASHVSFAPPAVAIEEEAALNTVEDPPIVERQTENTQGLPQDLPPQRRGPANDDDTVTNTAHHHQQQIQLGEAPVEREAVRQIQKAWQDLAQKAVAASDDNPDQASNDLDEELFLALEDDDDAVLQTRLAETKAELEATEDPQNTMDGEDDDDELLEGIGGSSSLGSGGPMAGADTSQASGPVSQGLTTTSSPPKKSSQRDSLNLPQKVKKKKGHRRAESVEQAMFGLLSTPSTKHILDTAKNQNIVTPKNQTGENVDLIHVLSSKTNQSIDSPLLSTETLMDTAQAHVQEIRDQEKAALERNKKKKTPSNRSEEYDSEEEREQELQQIVQENGDAPVVAKGPTDGSALPCIEEDEELGVGSDDNGDDVSSTSQSMHNSDDEIGNATNSVGKNTLKRKKYSQSLLVTGKFTSGIQQDWALFQQFLTPRKATMWLYFKITTLAIVLPSLLIASLVFYLKEHPEQQELDRELELAQAQTNITGTTIVINSHEQPFIAWWFLFLGVRQVVTLTMALMTQAFLIDYLALGSRFSLKYLGAATTLLAVQARGWPCVLFFWAAYDLALLSGDTPLAHHWGYWQDWIALFNEENHSGSIVQSEWNYRILVAALVVGVAVAIKRVLLGLYLARQTLCKLSCFCSL